MLTNTNQNIKKSKGKKARILFFKLIGINVAQNAQKIHFCGASSSNNSILKFVFIYIFTKV